MNTVGLYGSSGGERVNNGGNNKFATTKNKGTHHSETVFRGWKITSRELNLTFLFRASDVDPFERKCYSNLKRALLYLRQPSAKSTFDLSIATSSG